MKYAEEMNIGNEDVIKYRKGGVGRIIYITLEVTEVREEIKTICQELTGSASLPPYAMTTMHFHR